MNVAYNAAFGWANPDIRDLEAQAEIPLLGEDPLELGLSGRETKVMDELQRDPELRAALERAFPENAQAFTLLHVSRALAAYQRSLISASSAYDRYVFYDEKEAMSVSARRGMDLFFSERAGCAGCHPAPLFMSPAVYLGTSPEPRFHNTGLYNLDGGAATRKRHGPLRAHSAPRRYGPLPRAQPAQHCPHRAYNARRQHRDPGGRGDHYASGGRNRGPTGEPGGRSPLQSAELSRFELRPGEREDLVASWKVCRT